MDFNNHICLRRSRFLCHLVSLKTNPTLEQEVFQTERENFSLRQGYLYPRLLAVHDMDPSDNSTPSPMRLTRESIRENGAYIMEKNDLMFLYIGHQVG